jgi:hypothetical protein
MPSRLVALIALAAVAAGCTLFGASRARELVAEAEAAYTRSDFETSYARAKAVRLDHPASPERDQAFALACASWKLLYHRDRYASLDSPWVAIEPAFLFDWLASYFGEASPEEPARLLFVGVPYGVYRDFEAFARKRPDVSRWALRVEDDNGIVRQVTAERSDAQAP